MPGRDRRGPMGMGPMTGRGRGYCAGELSHPPGRGYGFGPEPAFEGGFSRRRRGAYGHGLAYGRRYAYGRGPAYGCGPGRRGFGRARGYAPGYIPAEQDFDEYYEMELDKADEEQFLSEHIACLEEELKNARQVLADIQESPDSEEDK